MQEKLDALWLEILEPQIDGKVVSYLSSRHPDYKKLRCRQEELVERYPSIIALEVGDDEITLNKREHQALREYMDNQTEMKEASRKIQHMNKKDSSDIKNIREKQDGKFDPVLKYF